MSNSLDPLIQAKLRAFARRRRRLIIVRGVFAAIAVLFFTMILVAAVDFASTAYFNVFLPKWVRTTLSVVAYASVVVVMWRQCLTQLLHAPDERQLARLIEHAEPLLREDLISAVELGTNKGGGFDSEQFRGLLQEDVAQRMKGMQMKSLLPVALIRRYIGIAVVILACIAAGVILTNGQLHTLLLRALLPNANLANVSRTKVNVIEPLGGDKVVPQGSTQRVEIEITGQRTNKATLESETEQGGSQVIAMQPLGGDKFAATIQVQRENVKYRIKAGDHLSRDYQFNAKERPFITKFEKTYHFPKYAKRPDQTITETDGSLRALEGTEVDLLLLPNQPVQDAELRIEQGKTSKVVVLTTAPDGRLAARLPLIASGTYRVHLVSKETGFINEFSPENELRAEPDLVPSVELTQPKSDLILPNNELVDLVGQASDDLGLAKLAQLVKVNDGPWRETVIARDALGPKAAISHRWDLYDLNGKPGDLITTKLVATDLKGNKGESRPLQVTITAAAFELRRLQALDALRALNDTTHALADQTELLAKTAQRFREQIHSTDQADVRRQAVVALDGALAEFDAKYTEASTSLWNALREAPAGHMSAELVLLGRELSRLGIQSKRVAKTNVDLLAANVGLTGAKDLANDTQEACNQIQARARIAEQAMEAFTTAEEAAVLSENGQVVAREQTRLMELAAASGNDVAKWQPLLSRLRVALTQTKAIEDLVTPITNRPGSQLRDRSKQTIASLSKRRLKLEQALTGGEPSAKLLLEPTSDMTKTLKEHARQFAEWHRDLGWKPVEMVQAVHRSVGPSYENVSKLPSEINALRRNKGMAEEARGPLLDSRWAARGEMLKGHGDLEELRTTADNQFVGDLRVATSALEALHVLAGGTEDGQMEERFTTLDRSLRVLEAGHNLLELFDGLNFVATNERWDIRSLAARTQSPRDWKWLEARLRTVPDEMGRAMEVFQRDGQGRVRLKFISYDVDSKNPALVTAQINVGDRKTLFIAIGGLVRGTNWIASSFEKKVDAQNKDVSELTLADKTSGAKTILKLAEIVDAPSLDPGTKKAFEDARQILWKAQQLPAWRTLNDEMGNRANIERLPSSVKTDAELLAGQVKLALDLLRPQMELARQELAKLSPKISELANALAKEQEDLKKETAEQAQKVEKQAPEEAKKEAEQQLARQQKLDEKLDTLKDLIRAEANQKNILDQEQREQMRDADDALALLKDPPPKAEQALRDAANDAEAQQKADLERAREQQQKLQDALGQVAKHYDAKEQGKSLAETREALREAEKQLGVKEELDQQFAHAQMLAEMAQKNSAELLKELEAKLPNNPVMQKELSDISKDALASAEQKLNQASQQEKSVADQLAQQANQQQAAQQQADKKTQEQVAQTAADAARQAMEAAKSAKAAADNAEKQAEKIGHQAVDQQADAAGDKAEEAAQAAQEAMKAAEQIAKAPDAQQAAQAAEKAMQKSAAAAQAAQESAQAAKQAQATAQQAAQQSGEHQAENQHSAQQAGEAAQQAEKAVQAAQKAQNLAQQAASQAKAMAQNAKQPPTQDQPNAAKTAAQQASQAAAQAAQAAKKAQEAAENAEKQAMAAGNQPASQQADMAGNEAAKAADAAQSAANAAEKAAESGNAQQAAQAAQQAAQKAGEAAQAAEKAAGAAQQAQAASQQGAQQGGEKQGQNQEAAQQAGQAQQQAQAAAQAAKQAQAMAQHAAQQAASSAQQAPQLAQAANQQPAIAQNATEAAAELERAGRHEMRLGNDKGEQLQKLGTQVANTAKTEVPAAQQALQQAQMANQAKAAVDQAAGQLSQQLASLQNTQQGGQQAAPAPSGQPSTPANQPSPSTSSPAANAQPAGEQPSGNTAPSAAPAGQPSPATPAAPADAGAPASPAEQAAMARALDALDQQLNAPSATAQAAQSPPAAGPSAQANPPGGQPSQPGQPPSAAGQPSTPSAGQPGSQPAPPSAAQAAMAQAAQAAASAMRQNRAQQGMAQMPGAIVSQSQSEKSEGGAQAQGDAGAYKLDTTAQGLKRGEWGRLPKKLADQLTKGQQEAISGDYRQAVETYYKVIAERAKKP